MTNKNKLIALTLVLCAVMLAFASCADNTSESADSKAPESISQGTSSADTTPDTTPDTSGADTEKQPVDYGPLKITETDGGKTLTCGQMKITSKLDADTGKISGSVYDPEYIGGFKVEGTHIKSGISMDYYSYIEQMYSVTIDTVTFDDEIELKSAIGTTANNIEAVFWGEMKNCMSVNGAVYEGTTLLYVPAGLTGEYTAIPSTTKVSAGALAGTKLTKLRLPATVSDYKSATDGIAGLEVELYTNTIPESVDDMYNGELRVFGNKTDGYHMYNIYSNGNQIDFALDGDALTGDVPLTAIKYIESSFGVRIRTITFNTADGVKAPPDHWFEPISVENYCIKPNDTYVSVDGVIYTADMKTLVLFPMGRSGEFCIPDTVEKVDASAFNFTSLSKLTAPVHLKDKIEVYLPGDDNMKIEYK